MLGGILVIPTWEEAGSKAAKKAEKAEEVLETSDSEKMAEELSSEVDGGAGPELERETPEETITKKPTIHLIQKAITRLTRAGGERPKATRLTYSKASL